MDCFNSPCMYTLLCTLLYMSLLNNVFQMMLWYVIPVHWQPIYTLFSYTMYSFNTVASAKPRSFEILSPDYIFFKSKIASVLPLSISPFFVYFFNIEILFFLIYMIVFLCIYMLNTKATSKEISKQ